MAAVQRQGDANEVGGVITVGVSSVLVNGRPIATVGALVSPHPCCGNTGCPPIHCAATTEGGGSVLAGGVAISLSSHTDQCGHGRQGGSTDVVCG